ncbi:MAG TPA: type III-A CRISPR-associated RAMP protein Csm5 [Candidatus Limnocylindrales bacterium]|nr:type III-A CRISPR-associated RAMP protein Csm5 [Candidatus Limnocylindrales bacterium]
MRYRLTAITPLLVGDGQKLSPIDYMVWKDHVNVLDQTRIFRLLAKGPRLEGYLNQLKTAQKLDFASWGGFAQNFAGRRIPFENAASATYWNRASGETLFIPTFASGASGPYLPASAIKGALRTGMLFANWREGTLPEVLNRVKGERLPRRPGEIAEDQLLGSAGANRMRYLQAGDSATVGTQNFKIYLLRTSTIAPKGSNFSLGWKQSPRGAVDGARPDDSTPAFAEMASPGTQFEGAWEERGFFLQPDVRKSVRWPENFSRERIFEAANVYAAGLLMLQRQYASWAGLGLLDQSLAALEERLGAARESGRCLLNLGWGAGLPAKSGWLDTTNSDYRQILEQYGFYNRALSSTLPFPKTRRIVFLNNRPATLPGWAELAVDD